MQIGIIIQARTGSSRLPNKMILPFNNDKGILEILLIRLKEAELKVPIILATTTSENDEKLVEIANKIGITVFRGSETNVLDRFIEAAKYNCIQKIIRVCADNPLLDLNALKHQIEEFENSNADYWCYSKSDLTPTIKTHYGFWTEGIKLFALQKIKKTTSEKLFQEHVSNYIYTHPNKFNIHYEFIDKKIECEKEIRLTVDTLKDFNILKEIYSELINNKVPFDSTSIVQFIKSNSIWLTTMKNEITKNTK